MTKIGGGGPGIGWRKHHVMFHCLDACIYTINLVNLCLFPNFMFRYNHENTFISQIELAICLPHSEVCL